MRTQEPVTVVVSRRARPERRAEFERWLEGIVEATSRFPGYEGSTLLRPRGEHESDVVLIYRFASFEHLRGWQQSDERARWLAHGEPLTAQVEVRTLEGLEACFDLPAFDASPPRWKMILVTWGGLYPLILIVGWLTNAWVAAWPFELRAAPQSLATVVLMSWPVMPWLTRALRSWLASDGRRRPAP